MTTMDQAKLAFHAEATELLENMETALLQMENGTGDADSINLIFRAAHTIKGTAGVFSFDAIESFTHVVENVLESIRSGKMAIDSPLIAVLLVSRDHIGKLVELAVNDQAVSQEVLQNGDEILRKLRGHLGGEERSKSATEQSTQNFADIPRQLGEWLIDVDFKEPVLQHGMDPASFIRYLAKQGEITGIETRFDRMPPAEQMNAENCYLSFTIKYKNYSASKESIEKVFEFVKDDIRLSMLPPVDCIWEYISAIDGVPEDVLVLGELLRQSGTLTQSELTDALERQQIAREQSNNPMDVPKLGEILVEEKKVNREVLDAALKKQDSAQNKKLSTVRQLRVDADKLDTLINLVGELVISGATANLLAQRVSDNQLLEAISSMSRLVEEVRDSALRLRMVQIGETFNRFQRVVRDVSHEIGKDIHLVIDGGETELDKTMVEKIGDPLMHLVRNAMDHGIESAADRQAAGKPAQGSLYLNAYHDSGSIVIQVSDDGRGLNKEKILNKAIENGIVQPGVTLTDAEIYRLIFEAGLSTADKVTNLSGRGVGMDVVRRNIESLRGTVDVETEYGEGTSIIIRLPLTLAIIDGFLVEVAGSTYVIPLDMVVECMELSEQDRILAAQNKYINLRGNVLPLLHMRDMFGEAHDSVARENIVVVQNGGNAAGLVVDALLGEFQTVIKPLGKLFQNLQGVAGSTILGTGDVAVILDVPGLVQRATQDHSLAGMHGIDRSGVSRSSQMTLH